MKNSKIEVLIACVNEEIDNVDSIFKEENDNVNYLISHQVFDGGDYEFYAGRDDVRYYQHNSKGVSRNRNVSIMNSTGNICIIADEDIKFVDNFHTLVKKAYEEIPTADIILFKIKSEEGMPFKKYPKEIKKYTLKDSRHVNSIEITFKSHSIKNSDLKFNENFGLGTSTTGGEENLFIYSAIKKGLNVYYYPKEMVIHSIHTSGRDESNIFSEKGIFTRGANMYIHYPKSYLYYIIRFVLGNYLKYRDKYKVKEVLMLLFKGVSFGKKELQEID